MTPRAKRALKHVTEFLFEHGIEVEAAWLDPTSGKQREKVMTRHLVWEHMAENNPHMSLRQIALETGTRDHASIIYGIRRAPHWRAVLRGQIIPAGWRKKPLDTPET